MILIILITIICLSPAQAEFSEMVRKKDLEEILLTFNKVTTEFKNQAEKMTDLVLELDNLKHDVVYLKALNHEMSKHNKTDYHSAHSTELNENNPEVINQAPEGPNLEDRVQKLETFFKVETLRSCEEYAEFGIRTSGVYPIDPDGILIGQPPFSAYCRFDENTGQVVTEIMHNVSEDLINVENCEDPGCYVKNLSYISGNDRKVIETSQLEALIQLSSECKQDFYYECLLAPLRNEGVDYAYWTGPDGEKNVYFTGSASKHACDCFYSEQGCEKQDLLNTACNCDSNEPTPLVDTGSITKSSALPILSIAFGGLSFEMQQASYTIGRLACQGKNFEEVGTSCRSLKLAGQTKSGYYTIKKDNSLHTSTVYCDMSDGGYKNVPEFKELTSDAPLGTITAWIPKHAKDASVALDLPDGWLPCDGRAIENGPWSDGMTPNLNANGHFLRGGNENNAMEFEEDQMQDHEHTDPEHSHNSPPHSHTYEDRGVHEYPWFIPNGNYYAYGVGDDKKRTSDTTTVTINNSKSNIGGVTSSYRSGDETRPLNMKVIWVMKCW